MMIEPDAMSNDRVIKRIIYILGECTALLDVPVCSILLFGSRAHGDRNSLNDYEILMLIEDGIELSQYIYLENAIRLQLLKQKLFNVRVLLYTNSVFESVLFGDKSIGTFLYMICRENIVLYDKGGNFSAIKEKVTGCVIKPEEEFIQQCIEFSNSFGSEKWAQKWEKILMQYKYMKKRRDY